MIGRPPVTTLRPNVTKRTRRRDGATIITFDAYVRGENRARTYLRSYDSREEALAACETFIRDGVKPPPSHRGPWMPAGRRQDKPQAQKRPKAPHTVKQHQTRNRIAMIRAIAKRMNYV